MLSFAMDGDEEEDEDEKPTFKPPKKEKKKKIVIKEDVTTEEVIKEEPNDKEVIKVEIKKEGEDGEMSLDTDMTELETKSRKRLGKASCFVFFCLYYFRSSKLAGIFFVFLTTINIVRCINVE